MKRRPTLKPGDVVKLHKRLRTHSRFRYLKLENASMMVISVRGDGSEARSRVKCLIRGPARSFTTTLMRRDLWFTGLNVAAKSFAGHVDKTRICQCAHNIVDHWCGKGFCASCGCKAFNGGISRRDIDNACEHNGHQELAHCKLPRTNNGQLLYGQPEDQQIAVWAAEAISDLKRTIPSTPFCGEQGQHVSMVLRGHAIVLFCEGCYTP